MPTKTQQKPGCLHIFSRFFRGPEVEEMAYEPLPYRLRDDFLSPAELSFYRVLSTVISSRAAIFTKVRLADIFFVARPNENRSYFGRISQRHVDFLLCEPNTAKPIVGIELDDSSHNRSSRKSRDEFVNRVFETAQLPLVRFPVKQAYTTQEMLVAVEQYLEIDNLENTGSNTLDDEKISDPVRAKSSSAPLCPKCDIPMIIRTANKGRHQGKQFFGCKNYPNCREMLSLERS